MMDFQDVSNDELAAKLRSLGQDIGPVVDSTRHVYLKKLDRLMRGEEWQSPLSHTTDGSEFNSNEEMDTCPAPQAARNLHSEVRQRATEATKTAPSMVPNSDLKHDSGAKGDTGFSPDMLVTQVQEPPAPENEGSSIWLKLFLIAVVAFIIILILMNMEAAGTSRIGEL